MTDPSNEPSDRVPTDLERELAALTPARVPRRLFDTIAQDLDPRSASQTHFSLADRCLLTAMSAGSLAAAVIVAVLVTQSIPSTRPQLVTPPTLATAPIPRLGDSLPIFARADIPSPLSTIR